MIYENSDENRFYALISLEISVFLFERIDNVVISETISKNVEDKEISIDLMFEKDKSIESDDYNLFLFYCNILVVE